MSFKIKLNVAKKLKINMYIEVEIKKGIRSMKKIVKTFLIFNHHQSILNEFAHFGT